MDIKDPEYWDLLIKRSVSRFFLLAALSERSMHGYEIAKYLRQAHPGCCGPTDAMIYPALKEFLEGGYIECSVEATGARERKICGLTDKGREAYRVGAAAWEQVIPYLSRAAAASLYKGKETGMEVQDAEKVKDAVREHYANRAKETSSCCGPAPQRSMPSWYSVAEVKDLPEGIPSMGCGNPTAFADLKEGEVVLDLGSGAGLDCLIAGQKVGPKGKVIGVDMTPEMLQLARQNAKQAGMANVEFRLGEIEHLPVGDNSVDAIISNCVINLSPDKDAVFHEALRALKAGGRISVSDIVVEGELPSDVREDMAKWAGCIAGALDEKVYLDKVRAAGFTNITVEEEGRLGNISKEGLPGWIDKVKSIRVHGVKPA